MKEKKRELKKVICFMLIVATVIFAAFGVTAASGDANGDGRLSTNDAKSVLRHVSGLQIIDSSRENDADINGDGRITTNDAKIILRIVAGFDTIEKYNSTSPAFSTTEVIPTSPSPDDRTPLSAREVFGIASKYTVDIYSYNNDGELVSQGSGFYITSDGNIVTNYHVIQYAASIVVTDPCGIKYTAEQVLGYDAKKDIAIIDINADGRDTAVLSDSFATGDRVYALGSPLGLTGTFTDGMISTAKRMISDLNDDFAYIQMTVPINTGNSGGPLINEYGEVIGICSMSYNNAQNLNFAVPSSEIAKVNTSNPVSVALFRATEDGKSAPENFSGLLISSENSVTLSQGGTTTVYAIALTNGDYNLAYDCSSTDFGIVKGQRYGNTTIFYISARKAGASGELKILFDKKPDICVKVKLSSYDSRRMSSYGGIAGAIPDFGTVCGLAPDVIKEGIINGRDYYAFYYNADELEKTGVTPLSAANGYVTLLTADGFDYIRKSDSGYAYEFSKDAEGISVYMNFEQDNKQDYICIMVYY